MGEPQGYDRKEFIHRVGTFFLLVGIGLLVFFILSESAGNAVLDYFCWGTILLVVAFIFRAQYKKAYKPSGRFSVLQKFKRKPKEDKGKK